MFNIIISCFTSSVIIMSYGILFNKSILEKNNQKIDYYEVSIFGFIFISFISLLINFLVPINKIVGNIFLFIGIIYFLFYWIKSQQKKELILIIFFLTLITFSILVLSNINRPDAGLYHLPYVSILNENKIILGLTNLHYRFGHTSIIQYSSAIYNNSIFKIEFINLPLASIFSLYILFLIKKFKNSLKSENNKQVVIKFLIIIFSLYSFNRFSNYGNDAPSNIFFFILLVFLVEISNLEKVDNNIFYKITLISIFLFTLKPFMIIVLIIPFILLIMNREKIKILKDLKIIISLSFILIWVFKNVLISGCLIFPIKLTCIDRIDYHDTKIVKLASSEAAAWSKGFPDQATKIKLNFNDFNSNFNWVPTWKKNHFNKIKEKISPFLIFIIVFILPYLLINSYKNHQVNSKKNINLILLSIFSFICCLYWFIFFPVYRFGLSFLASFIILFFSLILFQYRKLKKNSFNYFWILIIIFFIAFIGKNYLRIFKNYNNLYINYPWPKIYTLKENEKNIPKKFEVIKNESDDFLYFYSGGEECMYSSSPCSHMLNSKLYKKKILGYEVFYLK